MPAGLLPMPLIPIRSLSAITSGVRRASLILRLSVSITGAGVEAGTAKPVQEDHHRVCPLCRLPAESVGGAVEIAAITKHEGFRWVQRKSFYPAGTRQEG